jgi:hypothetical protein
MGSRRGKLQIQLRLPAGFARIRLNQPIGRIGLIELDLLAGVPPWGYNRHFQVQRRWVTAPWTTQANSPRRRAWTPKLWCRSSSHNLWERSLDRPRRVCQGVCEMDGSDKEQDR